MLRPLHLPDDITGPGISEEQEDFMRQYAPETVVEDFDKMITEQDQRGVYTSFTTVLNAMDDSEANEYRLSEDNERQGLYDQAVFNHFAPMGMRQAYVRAIQQQNLPQARGIYSGFTEFWQQSGVTDQLDYLNGVDQERQFLVDSYVQHQQELRRQEQRAKQMAQRQKPDPDRILDPRAEMDQLYGGVQDIFREEINQRGDEIVQRGVEKQKKWIGSVQMEDHVKEKVSDFDKLLSDPQDKHGKQSKQIFKAKALIDEAFVSKGSSDSALEMGNLDPTSRRSLDAYADREAQALLESLDTDQDIEQLKGYAKHLFKLHALEQQHLRAQNVKQGQHIESGGGDSGQQIIDSVNANLSMGLQQRIDQQRQNLPQGKQKPLKQEIQ